jgi:hypothetical protein
LNAGLREKRKEEKGVGANEEKGMTTAEKFARVCCEVLRGVGA